MRLHCLQHVPFEDLGSLEASLRGRGHDLAWTRAYRGEPLPEPERLDALVVLGGPMGVHDTDRHPWLLDEKRFLARVLDRGRRVLGICLGAQLLAEALGAKVFANREPEIGWLPVERTPEASGTPIHAALPDRFEAFHWHGDTFDVPAGAQRVARSAACENQAFAFGEGVLGLQFHLETTQPGVRRLIENCAADLRPRPFVQTGSELLGDERRFESIHAIAERVLDAWLAGGDRG